MNFQPYKVFEEDGRFYVKVLHFNSAAWSIFSWSWIYITKNQMSSAELQECALSFDSFEKAEQWMISNTNSNLFK